MPKAYPLWFREKVVKAYEDGAGSFVAVGRTFGVGEATVNRWVSRKRRLGTLEETPRKGRPGRRKITEEGEEFIVDTLRAVPDSTLVELSAAYFEEYEVTISSQLMSVTVRRLGFTRKRGSFAHGQPSDLT